MALLGVDGVVEDFVAANLTDRELRLSRTRDLSTRAGLPYHPRGA
jgi:hypothetical protein